MRDVLDKQLQDRDGCPLGRADGIVVELREGKPPRVERLEIGFVVLARRISRGLERFAERWHKRFGIRRSARYQVPWTSVREFHMHHIKLDVSAEESVAFDWERWARRTVVERLPGGKPEEERKT